MLPVLPIGPLNLPVAPLVTIAAFWAALWVVVWQGRRYGLGEDIVFNAGFFGAVAGLLGARIAYVAEYWTYYRDRLGEVIALNLNTLAPAEGVFIGLLVAVIYLQRKHVPGAAFLDALAPGLAVFAAGLSLANFASGAAFGQPADLPWAVELWDARRHPTQLYDFILSVAVAFVALRLLRLRPPHGRVFGISVALLAASRFLTEGFRGDSALLEGGWRSPQFMWLGILLVSLIGLAWIDRRAAPAPQGAQND